MLVHKDESQEVNRFGAFLTGLRSSSGKRVKQKDIVALLPGWTASSYSRLENGDLAPRFDQLRLLYAAFKHVGVVFSRDARHQFIDLARKRIALQHTHKDDRADSEWAQLRFELARMEGTPAPPAERVIHATTPLLTETNHLLEREQWRQELLGFLHDPHKKAVILRGPVGIGKSSELNWVATHLFHSSSPSSQIILCDFRAEEQRQKPGEALDILIGTLLAELGCSQQDVPTLSLQERVLILLNAFERATRPLVILIDHCECMLQPDGTLATSWEYFLLKFLRSPQTVTLLLATRQWPGWFSGEHRFVVEAPLPPLSAEQSLLFLQQLGLEEVPVALLRQVCEAVGGIPLCLEWVAALVKQPLLMDDWDEFADTNTSALPISTTNDMILAVRRLLAEPHVFGGNLAMEIVPLLEKIVASQRLSSEARHLLQVLSLANLPLAKPALQVLCPTGPRPLKELRRASVLVAYPDRAQLLPMVAAAMYRRLSPEQVYEQEETLVQAYRAWFKEGNLQEHEQGKLITELATLLLTHHHLLEVAELLIRYGWLSFNLGHAPRLARLAQYVMEGFDWHAEPATQCGAFLLHYYLLPYIGFRANDQQRVKDHQQILAYVLANRVTIAPLIEVHVIHIIMLYYMNEDCFEEAQHLLDEAFVRMKTLLEIDFELYAMLLSKRAWLLGKWSDYVKAQGDSKMAMHMREQAIVVYEESIRLLREREQATHPMFVRKGTLTKKIVMFLNSLSYHLNRTGRFQEALLTIEQCIELEEQGYVEFGALAAAYGEKSQILAALGLFREALRFDEKARAEVQRCADTGDTASQQERWIYQVNQGRLYMRLGRIDEAEQLLREAEVHIAQRRKVYRIFAKEALMEIEQSQRSSHPNQLDWRWVERYRELDAYDAYWWWASAGPFTHEEQQQWDQLYTPNVDETTKERLGVLLTQSRERELAHALAEQREPRLHYPAIDIEEVRRRIDSFLYLDEDILQNEPNAIVRRLYHGTIEDELCFIRMIEATYEGKSDTYWDLNQQLVLPPTQEEMQYALSRVRQVVLLGLQRADTVDVSQHVIQIMQDYMHLSLDLSNNEDVPPLRRDTVSSEDKQPMLSAQDVRHFLETAFQETGFGGWHVVFDSSAGGIRVDSALKTLFLPEQQMTLETVRNYFIHEVLGHVSRSMAGEQSLLGLLGINTKGYSPTEEGLTQYYERTLASLHGRAFDDSGSWLGGLAIGLASGILVPAHTFSSLYRFFQPFLLLYRLLWRNDEDRPLAEKRAHTRALARCLRTFRGVPDLNCAGICHTRDVVYLRGRLKIEQAVAQDETVLDRLAVGKVALELLPDLQELGIVAPRQSLRKRAYDSDLDAYILSFASSKEHAIEQK